MHYANVSYLSRMVYQSGIGSFPLFSQFSIHAGFSWGKNAPNMSFHANKNENISIKRNNALLSAMQMPDCFSTIFINTKDNSRSQIQEVSKSSLKSHKITRINANILFTRDTSIALAVHPGDCPCAVIFAKEILGNPILGIAHLGSRQTDMQLPKKAIAYLQANNVALSTIRIGISPGISQDHYNFSLESLSQALPNADKWGKHIIFQKGKNSKGQYHINIQGYIVQQFIESGVLPSHIEAYAVDTFAAAEKGESFSHRYASVTNQLEKDGRFLLAAALI